MKVFAKNIIVYDGFQIKPSNPRLRGLSSLSEKTYLFINWLIIIIRVYLYATLSICPCTLSKYRRKTYIVRHKIYNKKDICGQFFSPFVSIIIFFIFHFPSVFGEWLHDGYDYSIQIHISWLHQKLTTKLWNTHLLSVRVKHTF